MASGSSVRNNNSGSKGFDFGSDDILCSYEDYGNQESSNGSHSDPVNHTNSTMEFPKSRMTRSSMFPPSADSPPEESSYQDVISTVEKTMKKYADNLMRFLEGISSRLTQLELYCYNLDKSIGEMRSDLVRDCGETDSKLRSLEKHLQEVHRSIQILRDKQELAATQKELAKIQLAHKESSSTSNSQQNEERATPTASDPQDVHGQQLALAFHHQVAPQLSLPTKPVEQQPVTPLPPIPPQSATQYYLPPPQIPNPPAPPQPPQGQYFPSDSLNRTPQMQDMSRVASQPTQSQVNQTPPLQPLPQWPQQLPQQVQPPQQPWVQSQIRPSSTAVYPPYLPSRQANPSPPETLPNSMPLRVPYSEVSTPGAPHAEAMSYGYGGACGTGGGTVRPQPPPQHPKASFGAQPGDGYTAAGLHPTVSPGNAYIRYEGEGRRAYHPPQHSHFPQSEYPPTSVPIPNLQPPANNNLLVCPPQFRRYHSYNELIENLVNMGCRGDHVVSVIQRLEESGQPVDFNAVLDRLNGHSSGGSQRGWSG